MPATSPGSDSGASQHVPLGPSSLDAAAGGALLAEFLKAVGHQLGPAGLTPAALARAVAQLLPIDAAGITTMVDVLRMPLGASTDNAERAEMLQSTLGEGPCLWAAETRSACMVDRAEMLRRWPLYGRQLLAETPFRSVASVPLASPGGEVFAALDIYAEDSQLCERLNLDEIVEQIAVPLAALLATCIPTVLEAADPDLEGEHGAEPVRAPASWYRSATARRHAVWVAIGMIMSHHRQPTQDALSLLRGYAFSHNRTLDDIADDIVTGRLQVRALIGPAPDDEH